VSDQIPSGQIPSGWYPDPDPGAPAGQQRYWDGSAWTQRTTAPSSAPTVAVPARRSGMFTRWGIPALVGVLAFLFGIGVGAAPADTTSAAPSEPATTATVTATVPAAVPQDQLDALAARENELGDRETGLDSRESELDQREADLDAREAALAEQEQAAEPAPPAEQGDECHPSYDPCVPIASDVDCEGGSGNGPAYTGTVRVIGPDEYDLDRDGDGVACDG
jgi:Protein of unknown function (DUF2510)